MATERQRLEALVNDFSEEMRKKLHAKRSTGWTGWRDARLRTDLENRLVEHALRAMRGDPAQWIDVANFAAFLWAQGVENDEPTTPR